MQSLKTYTRCRSGFTLIEVLVTLAIIGTIAALAPWYTVSAFTHATEQDTCTTLAHLVDAARIDAQRNIRTTAEGICFVTNEGNTQAVHFSGTSFDERTAEQVVSLRHLPQVSEQTCGTGHEIYFSPLFATTSATTITGSDSSGAVTCTITISAMGGLLIP